MKKILFILAAALMILTSCTEAEKTKETPKQDTPTEEGVTSPMEYVVKAHTFDEMYALTHEERAKDFLSAICLDDREMLDYYIQGESVDTLLQCDLDAAITDTVDVQFGYCATVQLDVKKGVDGIIPAGKYDYTLLINEASPMVVGYFGPSDRFDAFNNPKIPDMSIDYSAYCSYKFVEEFFRNAMKTSMAALDTDKYFDSIYHLAVHSLMSIGEDFTFTTTADGFKMYLTERFGYTDEALLERFVAKLDEDGSAVKDEYGVYTVSCAHGYGSLVYDLTDVSSKDGRTKLSYVIYSDSARTVQCAKAEFVFEENENSNIMKLVDIKYEKICNLTPSVFTV